MGESSNPNHSSHNSQLKLSFPEFSGENGWLYKAKQYFDSQDISQYQ